MSSEVVSVNDVVDISKTIHDHNFTIGWLLDSLRKNDHDFIQKHGNRGVKDLKAVDVSDGKGFASHVLRCTLTFVDSIDEKDVYNTVLKIPFFNDFNKNQKMEKFIDLHNFECDFYTDLAKIIDAPTPKIYNIVKWFRCVNEGCIHMEDMSLRGKTTTYFDQVNLTQIKCVIRHLARIHKNFLEADSKIWEGKYLKNQESFVDFLDMWEPTIETYLKKCKREAEFRPLVEKYQKFRISKEFCLYAFQQSYKDFGIKPVLVHGDLHFGNIMWAIDAEGNLQNEIAAIVDWQTIQEGSPMVDLARFLVNCADGIVRRQAENFAIDFYLECLLTDFGEDQTKIPYTKIQLQKAYNYAFLTQAFFIIGIPDFFISLMDDSKVKKSLKEAYLDFGVLKALHAYEDADQLLQGEMKDVFEKYGK